MGANTLQIFSASPRMWRAKQPDMVQVKLLQTQRDKHNLWPLVIHDSYLINLAAPSSELRERSIEAFQGEIERALVIGAEYLVAHPGNYRGLSAEQGILNVAEAMILACRNVNPALAAHRRPTILLENTAGAGAQLGGKLEELATIRTLAAPYLDFPMGYCLDTCHSYVAGFDLASEAGFQRFLKNAEECLGLENVPVFHTNDAKTPLASHMDRHANIGNGHIGVEGFRRLLNHPKLCHKTFILETPVDKPGDDKRELRALKKLVGSGKRLTSEGTSPTGSARDRKTLHAT